MADKNPEEIRCGACYTVSKDEYLNNPGRVRATAGECLQKQVASLLRHTKSSEHDGGDYIEFRLDIYAATPEKFWWMIDQEASKIALRFK